MATSTTWLTRRGHVEEKIYSRSVLDEEGQGWDLTLGSGLGRLLYPGDCLVSGGSWLLSCSGMVWCLSSVLSPLGAGTLTALQEERSLHMQLQRPFSLLLPFFPTSVSLPCLLDNAPLFIYRLG